MVGQKYDFSTFSCFTQAICAGSQFAFFYQAQLLLTGHLKQSHVIISPWNFQTKRTHLGKNFANINAPYFGRFRKFLALDRL